MLTKIWLWIGAKLIGFNYIDIYSPDKKEVTAITFSRSEEYINKIQEIK